LRYRNLVGPLSAMLIPLLPAWTAVLADIFSDDHSKAARYKRLSEMWLSLAASLFPVLVALTATGTIDPGAFLDPKSLYFTPGLWERSGIQFLSAFLFETPFALARGYAWLSIPALLAIYAYFAWKANERYKSLNRD